MADEVKPPAPVVLKSVEATANEQAVEYLEQLLEWAREGRLTAFCAHYRLEGEWNYCCTATENLLELIGHLEVMKFRQVVRTLPG